MTATIPFVCVVDQTEHESLEVLHKHVRYVLKLTQERYYTQHAPRYDRGTGKPIPFKAPAERYLQSEFTDKNSLRRFCKDQPAAGREWAIDWLRKRKAEKSLVYPPSQAELRTLMCPSRHYYETVGGYNSICERLGYTIRHGSTLPTDQLDIRQTIVVDTREQMPLELKHPNVKGTIRCGDYGLAGSEDRGVYIERKSLNDFIGTLSDRIIKRPTGDDSNLERFTRELERAEESGAYIVLLCEAVIDDVMRFPYLPQFKCRGPLVFNPETKRREREYRGVQPDHLFKNLRDLMRRFSCFQPLFVNGREQAATAVPRLLAIGRAIETVDLEWEYESGRLLFKD